MFLKYTKDFFEVIWLVHVFDICVSITNRFNIYKVAGELSDLLPVIIAANIIWLIGLSVMVYVVYNHYKRLGQGVSSGNLIKAFERVLAEQKEIATAQKNLDKNITELNKSSLTHFQKMGLVRFNPFNETGGDQSFSLCLLDKKNDGFVVSCLHTRDRTRIYAKAIDKGKSKLELSDEEKKALEKAKKS